MRNPVQSIGALVLIVEDHVPTARYFAEVVEHRGAHPMVAYDAQHALDLTRVHTPSLVITDLLLPGMHGDQLITALRLQLGADLPVILVSALPASYLMHAGANAVLAKPFRTMALEAVLALLLPLYQSDAAPPVTVRPA